MNETLKQELLDKGIIMTYEQWWVYLEPAFRYLSNVHTPEELYEDYVNEIVADYEQIEREKKR